MLRSIIILHLLGASIWVGGHLVLLFSVLPLAMKRKDPDIVLRFEEHYERVGIPALLIQLITGIWLANRFVPGILPAFTFDDPIRFSVAVKLLLLSATLGLGIHARLRIIPRLASESLPFLAGHVLLINALAIAMLVLGVILHTGS